MRQYLESKKWISCGINLDEDIHFSTSYLRMSIDKNIGHIFSGYTSFIAIYENFNEEYFLEEDECIRVAKKLIHKITMDYSWFEQILKNIIKRTDILCKAFDEHEITKVYLKKQDNSTLKNLYKMQLKASLSLYEYARIPEILDRGVNYFTNYLIEYLKKVLKKDDVYEEFLLMTATGEKSIFQKSDEDLQKIIQMIPKELLMNATVRSLRLKLPIEVKEEIDAYLDKWRYLEYHGYGMKRLLNFEDILIKIINNRDHKVLLSNENELEKKRRLIENKKIPYNMQKLFDVYPRLAITKLYRKYYQIRNFYFLDMILSEIALRMQEREEFVRSMLPEEILEYLENGAVRKEEIEARINECIYAYCDGKELIITDKTEIDLIKHKIQEKCENKNSSELSGYPVSKGFKRGKSVIINRRQDMKKFQNGDIILSDSADPDIFDIVKHAGAVLTVQGGATSHVALYCREQGIPAVIGIKNLMRIQDGTNLEVDAYSGEVRVLYGSENEESYDIGQKAKNLRILINNNFSVPDFSVLNYSEIKKEFECSEMEKIIQRISMSGLELNENKKYILRSSSINEDTIDESNVGRFSSISNIKKCELLEGIGRFIKENDTKGYLGSIVFQEMLPFEFCGVTITGDGRLNSDNYVTIEVCNGAQNRVTEGLGKMTRIIYDKDKDEIREVSNTLQEDISSLQINNLINKFLKIEKIWNSPVDIEWGIYKDKLYILQARPIVKRNRI